MTAAPLVPPQAPTVAIVGGGPAGLMAAEVLAASGRVQVHLYDAMPSVGRKFLLAGKGGLNLTHSEPLEPFISRYGAQAPVLAPLLHRFGPQALREWARGLGVDTFVGSSGRVFPRDLKAAPLLRAWLHRLRMAGVVFHMRHRWTGWTPAGALCFQTPQGALEAMPQATVLALGGASWPQLGSDGAWVPRLQAAGIDVAPLAPSNCGFDVVRADAQGTAQPGWTEHLRSRHAGAPVKNVALSFQREGLPPWRQAGEFVLTATGIEGSLVYAASGLVRDAIAARGHATVQLDLLPAHGADRVAAEIARPRGTRSLSTHLKSRLSLDGVKAALLHELLDREALHDPTRLASAVKALPLTLASARPIAEAISSAGGVRFEGLSAGLQLHERPGVFCAGEMLDWEAPTGGYLLTACMATGAAAAEGVLQHLQQGAPEA